MRRQPQCADVARIAVVNHLSRCSRFHIVGSLDKVVVQAAACLIVCHQPLRLGERRAALGQSYLWRS